MVKKEIIEKTKERLIWKLGSFVVWQLVVVMIIIFPIDFMLSYLLGGEMKVATSIYVTIISTYGAKSLLTNGIDTFKWKNGEKDVSE